MERKSKKTGDWLRQRELEQEIEAKMRSDEAKRFQEGLEQTIVTFGPRIKNVCEEFAHEIRGKLLHYSPTQFDIVDPHVPLGPGDKLPWKELFHGGRIGVTICSSYVLVNTQFCTDSLFEKCKYKKVDEASTGHCYYRSGNEFSGFYRSTYRIPLHDFTEDKLANVLEEFCKDAMNPKATTHTYGAP